MKVLEKERKRYRVKRILLAAGSMVLLSSFVPAPQSSLVSRITGVVEAQAATFSQFWFQDEQGNWKVKDNNGNIIANAWLCDDAVLTNGQNVWYLLDANGNMVTAGLVQDGTGNFYSLEMNHNGYFGMLRYVTGTYDGVNLTLEGNHNGSFAKILNPEGLEALKAKYGVTAVTINNSNCVYTSSFVSKTSTTGSTKKSSGGGGGGGGGSSSGGSSSTKTYYYTVKYVDESGNVLATVSGSGKKNSEVVIEEKTFAGYTINAGQSFSGRLESNNAVFKVIYKKDSTNTGNQTVADVIRDFKDTYIKEDMSEFEKEMMIIRYLIENVTYDEENYNNNTIPADSYTAYGALVNGTAVCQGYSLAFIEMAKACGLEAQYVRGVESMNHGWNKVKIDGNWYQVDVTWEDPITGGGDNGYGFDHLRNWYINLTDEEMAKDHKWTEKSPACTADEYSSTVVEYYMLTGVIDTQMRGDRWRKYLMYEAPENDRWNFRYCLDKYGFKLDDGSNYFAGENAQEQLKAYLDSMIGQGYKDCFYIATDKDENFDWLNQTWLQNNVGGKGIAWYVGCSDQDEEKGYRLEYMDEEAPLFTAEESKALLEEAREPDDANVFEDRIEAKTYGQNLLQQGVKEYTIVYKASSELCYHGDFLSGDRQNLEKGETVPARYIAVDGQCYVIGTYKFVYKPMETVLGEYLEEDKSNVFAEDGEAAVEYLKKKLTADREAPEADYYVIFEDGNHSNHARDLMDYVEEQNLDIEEIKVYWMDISCEGRTYGVDIYRVSYMLEDEEILELMANDGYLEEDKSNYVSVDDVDKAAAYLTAHGGSDGEKSYVVVKTGRDGADLQDFGIAVAEAAEDLSGETECDYYWSWKYRNAADGKFYVVEFYWWSATEEALSLLSEEETASPSNASRMTE